MNDTLAVFTILASAVVIVGALVAVARVGVKLTWDIRENKSAIRDNTVALDKLATRMDAQQVRTDRRLRRLEVSDQRKRGTPGRGANRGSRDG